MSVFGLILLITSVLTLGVLLVDDGHRWLTGRTTYTQWAGRKRYRQWLFIGGCALVPVGMAIHLFF